MYDALETTDFAGHIFVRQSNMVSMPKPSETHAGKRDESNHHA
ncbi:hypothetical protein AB1K70_22005 [Bremerella sp. JC770]